MEKKKRAGKRKRYLNDFRPAVNGEYIYTGVYYRPEIGVELFSRLRVYVITAVLLSAAFVFAAGLMPAAGSINCFYVILPFLAVIICCFIAAGKTLRLFVSGIPLREYIYERTVPALPGWVLAECIFAAVTLAAEAVYLTVNGFDGREMYTVAFMGMMFSTLVAALFLRRTLRRISWSKSGAE